MIEELAKKIWRFHLLNHKLASSDCLLILGSNDTRVAARGASLYLDGLAPLIVFSGDVGPQTKGLYERPEADEFAEIASQMGVPEDSIRIENQSTNTGDNIRFSRESLAREGLNPKSVIVVTKPFMERRAYATFKVIWPEVKVFVTSPHIPFDDYFTPVLTKEHVINAMVGDLQRIKLYPERGWQINQDIPDDVWNAFEKLVELGFDERLLK